MRRTEIAGANPVLDFGIDRDALGYVGRRPAAARMHPGRARRHALVGRRARRRRPHRTDGEQEIITQRRSEHFEQAGSEATPLPRRHAAQRPRVRAQRRLPDLEFRHRLPRADVARRRVARARRQHRRRADRQGELRAARFAGSHLDHGVDAHQELDARAAHRSRRRLSRPLRERHASASSPTGSTSPTRSGSTPTKSSSTSSRRPAAASRGCASTSAGTLRDREIFGPSHARARARGRTASRSTATAICGARWSIPTSCSC